MYFHVVTHNAAAAAKVAPLPKHADENTKSYVYRTKHWTVSDEVLQVQITAGPDMFGPPHLIHELLEIDALALLRCQQATKRFMDWYANRQVHTSVQIKILKCEDHLLYKFSCIADAIPTHSYFEHELEIPLNQTTDSDEELYLCHMLTR